MLFCNVQESEYKQWRRNITQSSADIYNAMADCRVGNTDGIVSRSPKRAEMFGILTGETMTDQGKPF